MNGILYVAADDEYIQETARSARSVNRHLPEIDIGICTNSNDIPDIFDTVLELNDPTYSFGDKVKGIPKSPYKKTIYLDSDTHVISGDGILDLFQLLDKFDFAAHPLSPSKVVHDYTGDKVPASFPHFNAGVMAFNDANPVNEMFDIWASSYERHDNVDSGVGTAPDQPSLREAIYQSGLRVAPIPFEYNYHVLHPKPVKNHVHILHQGNIENYEEIAKKSTRTLPVIAFSTQ